MSTLPCTSVASSASSGQLLAANSARKGAIIVNTDANDLYIAFGATATTADGGWNVKIAAGAYWESPPGLTYRGVISGIWSADGTGHAIITEY